MKKRINYLQIAIAIYVVAIIMYAFHNNHDTYWSLYRDWVIALLFFILVWFGFKKNRTELDKSLIIGLAVHRLFCLMCFQVWYLNGADWWDTPTWFCTIFAVCLFLGIYINRRASWK